MEQVDVLVVGAGIVGLATARAVQQAQPAASVAVAEKEDAPARHQSGRNSGVIHAGVYYAPGSDKARLCAAGRASMVEYCRERGIAHEVCGKVVVAVDEDERERLVELERRCQINGVKVETIGPERLRELEPHAAGVAALHVLETGIADYTGVCASLAREVEEAGGRLLLNTEILSGSEAGRPARGGDEQRPDRGASESSRAAGCRPTGSRSPSAVPTARPGSR